VELRPLSGPSCRRGILLTWETEELEEKPVTVSVYTQQPHVEIWAQSQSLSPSSGLKMEKEYFSETLVRIDNSTWPYSPQHTSTVVLLYESVRTAPVV
jgi:hypothetical protein